jgi:demethoxyubiquinone hydroxylase (CLK1/Coq7/Cat5 family)
MALSVAHMSIELVKQEQRIIIAKRAEQRAKKLQVIYNVIQRKRDNSNLVEFFFAFQVFLAGAFVSALYYA